MSATHPEVFPNFFSESISWVIFFCMVCQKKHSNHSQKKKCNYSTNSLKGISWFADDTLVIINNCYSLSFKCRPRVYFYPCILVRAWRWVRPWVNRTHEEHVYYDSRGKPCPAFCPTKARPQSSDFGSRGHVADHRNCHTVMLVCNQASTRARARSARGSPSTVKSTVDELYIQEFWHHVNSRFLIAQLKACRQMPVWVLENGCSCLVLAIFNSTLTASPCRAFSTPLCLQSSSDTVTGSGRLDDSDGARRVLAHLVPQVLL